MSRKTDFIDLEFPLFKISAFNEISKYLNNNIIKYGFGLDTIWNKIIKNKYIINNITIIITQNSPFLMALNRDYENITPTYVQEKRELLRYYNFIKKYLTIVPTGDNTYHNFSNKKLRNFDVAIIYFNDNTKCEKIFREQSEYFFKQKAPKWKLIKQVLPFLDWQLYDYIWIPDDDLVISIENINKMFEIAEENKLQLCQPAVAIPDMAFDKVQEILKLLPNHNTNSVTPLYDLRKKYPEKETDINKILYRVSYPSLIRKFHKHEIRKADIIEIQMPLFSRQMLKQLYKYITDDIVNTGFGLDILWSKIIKDKYVIDYIEVEHMRDTGFGKYEKYLKGKLDLDQVPEQYRNLDINPKSETNQLLNKFKINLK
jgi:hypothetical protein